MPVEQRPLKIWNEWEEFGLLVGLGHWSEDGKTLRFVRFPGETNLELKRRILKSFSQKEQDVVNSSHQGMVNAISRDLGLVSYNVEDKKVFTLSQEPHPTGRINVYVSGVSTDGDWVQYLPQVRSSGYFDAINSSGSFPSGWIVWNLPDHSGDNGFIHNGEYTQILEFINFLVDADEVRTEYEVLDRFDEDGEAVLKFVSDFDHPDDDEDQRYRARRRTIPNPLSQVVIHPITELISGVASGIYYTDEQAARPKLKELREELVSLHPFEWDDFVWGQTQYDAGDFISLGTLPSLYDAAIPTGNSSEIHKSWYIGGVNYGPDLYMHDIRVVGSGVADPWNPVLVPGIFYLGPTGYYLYEQKREENITLASTGGDLIKSGVLVASSSDVPDRISIIVVSTSGYLGTSGNFSELYKYPIGSGRLDSSTDVYRRVFPLSGLLDHNTFVVESGQWFFDYDNQTVFASGLPDQINVAWEHPSSSGYEVVVSGVDLNPVNRIFDKHFLLLEGFKDV